jgi:BirA family biotin operon repressor/biotin-[acetyl-CoA-carboxylase] ligase
MLDLPVVELFDRVPSTMDVAHAHGANGAPAGTLVLADEQTAGRGRVGRRWASAPGAGIWLTLLERPGDPEAAELLAIRLGLRAARVLDRWTEAPVRLKWPNDLYVGRGKLSGILVETRWRDQRIDWVAIGFGLNVRAPDGVPDAAALRAGASRIEVLAELLPALRAAAAARGALDASELAAYEARDLARGRTCREPAAGVVQGIDERGSLMVATSQGVVACRSGSLVFEET